MFFLQCLLIVVLFVLHLSKLLHCSDIFYIHIFQPKYIDKDLDFVKALNIVTNYGQHLSKKNHCYWRFATHNFQLGNYFA